MEKNNGILELKTKKQGNKCLIEIKDNGTGMTEDTLQKIFEPYFTSKGKRQRARSLTNYAKHYILITVVVFRYIVKLGQALLSLLCSIF
jgi:signal transduction histidine kinase